MHRIFIVRGIIATVALMGILAWILLNNVLA